jgi:hypothetical protein
MYYAQFVIPVAKYHKAINTQVNVGMRFRMVFETEESSVRRWAPTTTCSSIWSSQSTDRNFSQLELYNVSNFIAFLCAEPMYCDHHSWGIFILKLQIHGHYHWDRWPGSHQVAKVRLALPQGVHPICSEDCNFDHSVYVALCVHCTWYAKWVLMNWYAWRNWWCHSSTWII